VREAVEPGKEDTLGDVRLVELVAHLPFQLRRDDEPSHELRPSLQPLVETLLGP
jgi:hypothetical protein